MGKNWVIKNAPTVIGAFLFKEIIRRNPTRKKTRLFFV